MVLVREAERLRDAVDTAEFVGVELADLESVAVAEAVRVSARTDGLTLPVDVAVREERSDPESVGLAEALRLARGDVVPVFVASAVAELVAEGLPDTVSSGLEDPVGCLDEVGLDVEDGEGRRDAVSETERLAVALLVGLAVGVFEPGTDALAVDVPLGDGV